MHNGKNGIATIIEVVQAGGVKKNNGQAVIFRYAGSSYPLKLGKAAFL